MKTIKFRCFDTLQGGKFEYWDSKTNAYDGIFWFMIKNKSFNEPQQYTGLKDKNGKEIFEGDILSDWNEVDGKQVQSKLQVYWCEKTGAWKLDHSFNQDKSSGDLLCEELADFVYEITGNVYQRQSV